MIGFKTVVSSLVAIGLAVFVSRMVQQLDEELNACGTGVFRDGKCHCVHPYTGTHCHLVDCGFGELVDSQFLVDSITTPFYEDGRKIVPGCKCDSKFWGYNCANCTTKSPSDCSGVCKDNYYGARCDILCKEAEMEDAQGEEHLEAGGVYNFFLANDGDPFGLCQYDGSVRCREGRAGSHCEFQCKDCVYGACNLEDGTCDCFDGYYGEFCESTCPGRCSGKNGVCQDDGKCKCEPGFTSEDCSLECCVRGFGTDIGRVHGDCDPKGGCICDEGWSGDECDCNAEITCSGRGVCSEGRCVCDPEFQGARCEMCDDLRVGPFCQYERYQCPSLEMINGEFVAVNSHGDYACKCNTGFMGDHCEMCTPSAYPKSGPVMCTYIVPASLCGRGAVKEDFAGFGTMCDCEANFDPGTDCQNCKSKYYGPDCDIFCDVQCSNSGGTCVNYPEPGCQCPLGKTNVGGICVVCGGDSECVHGECFRGQCQCDPGYYGDDCSISAPIFNDKVCNGYTPILKFETATCDTATDCTSTDSESLANRQVAYRAQQYGREMFCHRLDTPIQLKDETGCCVDSDFDGKCDKNMLNDQECSNGEIVVDICNERVLEGEVNVFEWCLSVELGCLKNGECADPDLCQDRCDLGLQPEQWEGRWERDHIASMETLMSEPWKFSIDFEDPYVYREKYTEAEIEDVCYENVDYNVCRDYLIPDARVYNLTKMYTDEWIDMPSFKTCEFGRYVFDTSVNGTKTIVLDEPIWAGRIEVLSENSAAFGRYGQNNESYPYPNGTANTLIDSLTLYGKGKVEVVIYNYTTDECSDLIRRSAYHYKSCENLKFHELDYDWSAFCEWRLTVSVDGGFDQRCYDQSRVCAGCEDYQEGCEGLPLRSEVESPLPPPCNTYWEEFCLTFMNETAKPTGYCAYAECDCDGYAVGGDACNLQCPVPQFTGTEAPCGEDMDPPWGKCNSHIGAIAFGFEQGECDCYNGGSPTVGCAQVCEGEQDCSPDVDTPYSFIYFNCSDIADVTSIEILSETEQVCHVNLRDSVCNYWRGRCECATPFTVFTKLEQPIYFNEGSYRVSLMQGYEIDEYAPFMRYVPPQDSILRLMKRDRLCADELVYLDEPSLVCDDTDLKRRNTDWIDDVEGRRCKDYKPEDCLVVELLIDGAVCDAGFYELPSSSRLPVDDPHYDPDPAKECMNRCLALHADTRAISLSGDSCSRCSVSCELTVESPGFTTYKIGNTRVDTKIPSNVPCEEDDRYVMQDVRKDQCLSFLSSEFSDELLNDEKVFDFGELRRVSHITVEDAGALCQQKPLGPHDNLVYGCDSARDASGVFDASYCGGTVSNAHLSAYYSTCCEWTGTECVDKYDDLTPARLVVEQAESLPSWSFVDFLNNGENYLNLTTRFLRVRGEVYQPVRVKPFLAKTDLVLSHTKQGCIMDESDVTYYDFKPNVYTSEPVECAYEFRTFGECDVSYSKGPMAVEQCSIACGEDGRVMFSMVDGECKCGADSCQEFTVSPARMYHITGNDACGFKFRFQGTCTKEVSLSVADKMACRDECRSLDYPSFTHSPCKCVTGCTKGVGYDIYHIQSGYESNDFISVQSKSCETYGHKTIESEDLCRNASLVMGHDFVKTSHVGKAALEFADRVKQAVIHYDGAQADCPAQDFIWNSEFWMGTDRKLELDQEATKFRCLYSNGDFILDIEFDDVTFNYLSVNSVAECKENCGSKHVPYAEVETIGTFTTMDTQCSKDSNKIKDVIPDMCLGMRKSITDSISQIGCDGARYTSGDFGQNYCEATHGFFQIGHEEYNEDFVSIGEYYKTCCKWDGTVCKEKYIPDICRNPVDSPSSFNPPRFGCDGARLSHGGFSSSYCDGTSSNLNSEQKHFFSTCCVYENSQCKDKYVDNVKKECLEEDCSYTTTSAIYSECNPVDQEEEYAYTLQDGGYCKYPVLSEEECEKARLYLHITYGVSVETSGVKPPGCSYKDGQTLFNDDNPDLVCGHDDYNCICRVPLSWKKVEKSRTCTCSDTDSVEDVSGFAVYNTSDPHVAHGCSSGVFNPDESNVECSDCICQKGEYSFVGEYVEVSSLTCEDHGFFHLRSLEDCLEALLQMNHAVSNLHADYFSTLPLYTHIPKGCSKDLSRVFSLMGTASCSEDTPCVCAKKVNWRKSEGRCDNSWKTVITATLEECKQKCLDDNFCSSISHLGSECEIFSACRHVVLGDWNSYHLKDPFYENDRYILKYSGKCTDDAFDVTSREECLAAAAMFGLLKAENTGHFVNHVSGAKCGIWEGYANFGTLTTECKLSYPCICRREREPIVILAANCEDFGLSHLSRDECESYSEEFEVLVDGTMPKNKCIYANGKYYFTPGSSSVACSARVPCVCKGASDVSIGDCPEGTSRPFAGTSICYPTDTKSSVPKREFVTKFVSDRYVVETIGSGMCAPDHDMFFHNRPNPYRVSDDKEINSMEKCKQECMRTDGCNGFSFSEKPSYNFRDITYRDGHYFTGSYLYVDTFHNEEVLGDGVHVSAPINGVNCMQRCEEFINRADIGYVVGEVAGARSWQWQKYESTFPKQECVCYAPQEGQTYATESSNYDIKEFSYTVSEQTCVLSYDGCDKPVLLGPGKCKFGIDHFDKTMEECEQLCIDDTFCRVFSFNKGTCRVSGRECHYVYDRFSTDVYLREGDAPPDQSAEHDYVILLVNKMDALGNDDQTNAPPCRGDCDTGECAEGFTCYKRGSDYPPPPGCYDPDNVFLLSSGTDYCVYNEYMDLTGDAPVLKAEILNEGILLPHIPTGATCEDNGWHTIFDEKECAMAADLLYETGLNLKFELQEPTDHGPYRPSGCYFSSGMLYLNTNTAMFGSTHEYRSICRRGWKRYSLGKTNLPGTRYKFTKKMRDLSPHSMAQILRAGQEYTYEWKSDLLCTTNSGPKMFTDEFENPGTDLFSRLKFCAEACQKTSYDTKLPWSVKPSMKYQNDNSYGITGVMTNDDGRCYCQLAFVQSASKRNVAAYTDSALYERWEFGVADIEFVRRREFQEQPSCSPSITGGQSIVPHITYDAKLTPGNFDDPTGRARKCGIECKALDMHTFIVDVDTGHCECYDYPWDACGDDFYYNSISSTYIQPSGTNEQVYEILQPKRYKNMHYGKGRYCGEIGEVQTVTATGWAMQEECYELCKESRSFLLDNDGNCVCQSTKPECDSLSGSIVEEESWIMDKGHGQCESGTDVKIYDIYESDREDQISKCAFECLAKGGYAGFVVPVEGSYYDLSYTGQCWCEELAVADCSFADTVDEAKYELKYVGNPSSNTGAGTIGMCEGDCDEDEHCAGHLKCFSRTYGETVPGCLGNYESSDSDFCYDPRWDTSDPEDPELYIGVNPSSGSGAGTVALCQGDCDEDAHCAGDLVCFQRSNNEAVPGCSGTTPHPSTDICYDPSAVLVQDWHRYEYRMIVTGTEYPRVKFSSCVSLCNEVSCTRFSYSNDKCVIADNGEDATYTDLASTRVYRVSNTNTYQQFAVLNENPSRTPVHMGIPLPTKPDIQLANGFLSCSLNYQTIERKSCEELGGVPISSADECQAAVTALGYSYTVQEVTFYGEPSGCFVSDSAYYNEHEIYVAASASKSVICKIDPLALTKEQCEAFADLYDIPFTADDDIPEFDSVCYADNADIEQSSLIEWTPYKEAGVCFKKDFTEQIKDESSYTYEKFTNGTCMSKSCEKVSYRWTELDYNCMYGDSYGFAIPVSPQGKEYDLTKEQCIDACVQMMSEGQLGAIHSGVHNLIINRDVNKGICFCLPLKHSRFCNEDAPVRSDMTLYMNSNEDYYQVPARVDFFNGYNTISVYAEIKCNYASVFNSFQAFHKSILSYEEVVEECFKACASGSMFNIGGIASVGDMKINGFRVDRGTYSKEIYGSCECVQLPYSKEECEIPPDYTLSSSCSGEISDETGVSLEDCKKKCNADSTCIAISHKGDRCILNNDCTSSSLLDMDTYKKTGVPTYKWVTKGICNYETETINGNLEECVSACNAKEGCDGFSLERRDTPTCKLVDKECIDRGLSYYADIYIVEDVETFKIKSETEFEVIETDYSISTKSEEGSPVFFPKTEFVPPPKSEWFTHLEFTKYSVEENCGGKENIYDDECEEAIKLFPEWQVSECLTGYVKSGHLCVKYEVEQDSYCNSFSTVDETVLYHLNFTSTIGNEDYVINDEQDPALVVCETFQVNKDFGGHPLSISNSQTVLYSDVMTRTITLEPGTYTYFCSSHPDFMRGSLVVQQCGPQTKVLELEATSAEECALGCSEAVDKGILGPSDSRITKHFASVFNGCKCHFIMSNICKNRTASEGSMFLTILTTEPSNCINDDEMICKISPEPKTADEMYLCNSEEEIKVFDSSENCAVCGGGEYFQVGSVFFNENGADSTCRYAEETSVCDEKESGWSQYQIRPSFTSYEKAGRGYCEGFLQLNYDFSTMILSEKIEACASGCKAYPQYTYFSVSRTSCYCTDFSCETKIGDSDTFIFFVTVRDADDDPAEKISRWNSNAPGLRCFKDLDHSEEVPCDWIRALKHFARGGSYRIGDCHNLAPGTDITTQVPCSGHGFPSAGTCACDYAENFELRSSGVGLTFEAPNLRQTPYRGKACGVMCPGYDMFNMDSVCSGHGRCETDGRCACEQGYTGYKCHLSCENGVNALTCSGHGVCNEVVQELRADIVEELSAMECHNETLYLSRDVIIKVDDEILHMYKGLDNMQVDTYVIPKVSTVEFVGVTEGNTSYSVIVDGGEEAEDPRITVCREFSISKAFAGHPLVIQKITGETLLYLWDDARGDSFNVDPGVYEYFSSESPVNLRGVFEIINCNAKYTRDATIEDYSITGEAVRMPFDSLSAFPYMPCKDRLNVTREAAYHKLIQHTTPNVTLECSLLPGFQEEAYTLVCGSCKCEESRLTGFWTGHDCRTPALGYLGKDGRDTCPGMTGDKRPCNGGGTCTWGSVDGLGTTSYVDAQCFCGDVSADATYATAPRNKAGDMMFHVMNFDDPLYMDTLSVVDGNLTECFEGTVSLDFEECQYDWVSNGGVETIVQEAAIVTSVRNDVVLDYEAPCSQTGTVIHQITPEDTLMTGSKREQNLKCAGACFGEYTYIFNGKCTGEGVIVFNDDTNPGRTWDEKTEMCADACRAKRQPIGGDWTNTANPGFSIRNNGECVCETQLSDCTQLVSNDWKRFDFVTPYVFTRIGSCVSKEYEIGPPSGGDRLAWCGSMCQRFVFDDGSVAKGFLYSSSNPNSCVCQAEGLDCNVQNDGRSRYDYTHFKGFTAVYGSMCSCETLADCEAGEGDGFRFKILGDVNPQPYRLEQRESVFNGDFICLKEDTVQCKAGPTTLNNYNRLDCSCNLGFTGPTCETIRMMCIFSGIETDGTACVCPGLDGNPNPKLRTTGCCTQGLYWDQIRYSTFSPLTEFEKIFPNIFYRDALKAVCRPGPNKLVKEEEGVTGLKIHNFAAMTDEYKISRPSVCSFPKHLSLYKAVYKYNAPVYGVPTLIISEEEISLLGYQYDNNTDTYLDDYAKQRCLYRCTHRVDDEPVFKAFHLNKTRTNKAREIAWRSDYYNLVRVFDGKKSTYASYANRRLNPGSEDSSTIEDSEIEACRDACSNGMNLKSLISNYQNEDFWELGLKPTHFSVDKYGRCYCHTDDAPINTARHSGYGKYELQPLISYECRCMETPAFVGGNLGKNFIEPIHKENQKVFDIVFPKNKEAAAQNIECFDTGINVKHVDIDLGETYETMTGIAASILPHTLRIESVLEEKQVTTFLDCYKECSQHPEANSFTWGRKPQVPIVFAGDTPHSIKLKHCWGHCDSDSDCEDGLVCAQRDHPTRDIKVYAWPGCIEPTTNEQQYGTGGTLESDDNICYDPSYLEDQCFCTVHNESTPDCVRTYSPLSPGYCDDYVYLSSGSYPDLLDESDPLYDEDRVRECMNRCLDDNPNAKAFFVKYVNNEPRCACAKFYCAERSGSNTYTSYQINQCEDLNRDGYLLSEHTDDYKIVETDILVSEDNTEYTVVPVNPYVCGIETIYHQGDIVSSDCHCPVGHIEVMYLDEHYVEIGDGVCKSFHEVESNYCEDVCDKTYGCNSFSKPSFMLKYSSKTCTDSASVDKGVQNSLNDCAEACMSYNGFLYKDDSSICYCEATVIDGCSTESSTHNTYVYARGYELVFTGKICDNFVQKRQLFLETYGAQECYEAVRREYPDLLGFAVDPNNCLAYVDDGMHGIRTSTNPNVFCGTIDFDSYNSYMISEDAVTCSLAVDCDKGLELDEFAPFFCYGGEGDGSNYENLQIDHPDGDYNPRSLTKCFELAQEARSEDQINNNIGRQFSYSMSDGECYGLNKEYIDMDDCTDLNGDSWSTSHLEEAKLVDGTYTAEAEKYDINAILDGYLRNDFYYGNLRYHSYYIRQRSRFDPDTASTRYIKRVDSNSKERYCTIGETTIYSVDVSSRDANDHTCMQKCSEEYDHLDYVVVRGEVIGDIFNCKCSDKEYTDCEGNMLSGDIQYKVTISKTKSCSCPGFYLDLGNAVSCPPGRYSGPLDPCTSSCKLCPRGKFSEVGYSECESCSAGKIQVGLTCVECSIGRYSPAGENQCFTCNLGYYAPKKGLPACYECPLGYYDDIIDEGRSCKKCALGEYSGLAGKGSCKDCPKGTYGDTTPIGSCKRCVPGMYQDQTKQTSSSSCKICAVGKYASDYGTPTCPACSKGKYNTEEGKPGCISCPEGWYQDQSGKTSCTSCAAGKYASRSAFTYCYDCPKGYYNTQTGLSSCTSCKAGYYNNQVGQSSSSACHTCAPGMYQGSRGKSSCSSCGEKYSSYSWANKGRRIHAERACDMYRTSYPSYDDMYDDWDNWACKYKMTGESGLGDRWRRRCLLRWDEDCHNIARTHGDKRYKNEVVWTDYWPWGRSSYYKACIPGKYGYYDN